MKIGIFFFNKLASQHSYIYIYFLFEVLRRFQHCAGHITTGGRAEETSTYSWSRFCTVNCRPTASNYQLSHLRLCREPNPGLRGRRLECYHSATVVPTQHSYNHLDPLHLPFLYLFIIMDKYSPNNTSVEHHTY